MMFTIPWLLRALLSIPLLSIPLLLLTLTASAEAGVPESDRQSEFFRQLSLPGALSSCRRLLQTRTQSLFDCLEHWMRLKRQAADPGFIRYAPSVGAGGCEISVWCDQLLLNESEPHTALLPASRGQPRIVLFAVKSGSQVKVLDSFLSPVNCNRSLLVSPLVGPPPLDFWRSCWLDRLPDLVRLLSGKTLSVELIKDGATALKISFDANFAGLNLTNWFSKDRLVGSEPDLALETKSYNYVSVFGHAVPDVCNRTFYINIGYSGCSGDAGVLAVTEITDVCPWSLTGSDSTGVPRILYNPAAGVWHNNAVLADYLLITAA